jgi:hypothetical protein
MPLSSYWGQSVGTCMKLDLAEAPANHSEWWAPKCLKGECAKRLADTCLTCDVTYTIHHTLIHYPPYTHTLSCPTCDVLHRVQITVREGNRSNVLVDGVDEVCGQCVGVWCPWVSRQLHITEASVGEARCMVCTVLRLYLHMTEASVGEARCMVCTVLRLYLHITEASVGEARAPIDLCMQGVNT